MPIRPHRKPKSIIIKTTRPLCYPSIRALVIMAGCATNGWKIQEHQYRYDIERDENLTEDEKEKALRAKMKNLRVAVQKGKANPWFNFFLEYMPLPITKKATCPVLVLHGDKKSHVPVEHAHYLAQAIPSSGNPDVTVRIFKDINHPFLPDWDNQWASFRYSIVFMPYLMIFIRS